MSELPSGTVTLLFSDVEGSTALVRELGGAWGAVLQRQRELCRRAWKANGGHELGTEGDSFFVAFATAEQAVTAAIEAQRAIVIEAWPAAAVVRVRIGIHTGTPMRNDEGYVGLDVHKAARVSAAAHGGQILISEATAALLPDDAPTLYDRGEHALKDIPHRLRLHQVTAAGLARDFPPLKTQGGAGSLPPLLTPTVGRDGELAELRNLLVDKQVRLVTLTGPGGTGKTRLAITLATDLADEYADGVYFVPLDSLRNGDQIWPAIAQVLEIPANGQVPPGFFDHVGDKRALLILDNLEQIHDADAVVRELLINTPHVSVVATSRRALHVSGEYDHEVPPLELPAHPSDASVAESGAVQMFVEHAARAKRGFTLSPENSTDIATLVTRLDGLPLAIELAAARTKIFSPAAILARMDKALDVASTDHSRDDRHRTLRNAIDWSYQLLDPEQRAVLNYLGVFEGGADLDAIEAVVPADDVVNHDVVDLLFDLVDASLVRTVDTDSDEPRFTLLETVKRFTHDQLAGSGRLEEAFAAHAQHFYERAKRLYAEQHVTPSAAANEVPPNLDNFRAMIDRGANGVTDVEWYEGSVPQLHVAALLANVGFQAGQYHEAIHWTRVAEAWPGSSDGVGLTAVRVVLAILLGRTSQDEASMEVLRSLTHSHSSPALPPWVDPVAVEVAALNREVWEHCDLGQIENAAEPMMRLEALHPPPEQAWQIPEARYVIAYEQQDFDAAHRYLTDAVQQRGGSTLGLENNLADLDLRLGNLHQGQARLAKAAQAAALDHPYHVLILAATLAAIIGHEHPLLCARVYGCYQRTRVLEAIPNSPLGVEEDEAALADIRPLVTSEEWEAAWAQGATENLPDLILEMAALPPLPED